MRAEWDGTAGFIQTGKVSDDFDEQDFEGILREFADELHYDPAKVEIAGNPQVVVWETGFRNKEGSGRSISTTPGGITSPSGVGL